MMAYFNLGDTMHDLEGMQSELRHQLYTSYLPAKKRFDNATILINAMIFNLEATKKQLAEWRETLDD